MALTLSGNFIIPDIDSSENWAVIGYDNFFTDGTITVSSESSGYEKELAVNGFTNDSWKPNDSGTKWIAVELTSSEECDYGAIAAHNLNSIGATVTFQYSTDGGSTWNDLGASFIPEDNSPLMQIFESGKYGNKFRLLIDSIDFPYIGVVQMGKKLRMPADVQIGHSPMALSKKDKVSNSLTEGGHFVGRSLIRRGAEGSLNIDFIDPQWIRDYWMSFVEHAQLKPFFLAWSPVNYPSEVVYGWTNGNISTPQYSYSQFMRINLAMSGIAK